MRVVGLDLGSKRIGVAVSDLSGTIASPLLVLQRSGSTRRDHEQIARLVADEEAEAVVVGLPLNMNGSEGPAAVAARKEAAAIATVVGVPVHTWDERRSTVTADQAMLAAGLRAPQRRQHVDKVAAAVFLQAWLDAHPSGGR